MSKQNSTRISVTMFSILSKVDLEHSERPLGLTYGVPVKLASEQITAPYFSPTHPKTGISGVLPSP